MTISRFIGRYENLESMFKALKTESQKSLAFLEEARSTMSSLKNTQESALNSLKGQQSVFLLKSGLN